MPAVVLALGLIVAASIGAYAFYGVRSFDNTLSVTGSATMEVEADAAKWTVSISRLAFEGEIPYIQSRVSADTQRTVDFFEKAGVAPEVILVSPVSVDQEYTSDTNAPRRYNVRQDISISSDDPAHVERLSHDIEDLIAGGILVNSYRPEYYVTGLPSIRVALVGKAVEDARARAIEIASSTGQKVGRLKSASSGVVQVMAPNSVEVSDYGSYDTSTIDKQVMVTARAVFFLR
jgi:hypothetical protein